MAQDMYSQKIASDGKNVDFAWYRTPALNYVDKPALRKFMEESKFREGFVGMKIGVRQSLSDAIDSTRKLGDIKAEDGSDIINGLSAINQAAVSWLTAYAAPVSGGVYASFEINGGKLKVSKVEPMVSQYVSAGHTEIIGDKMHFKGTMLSGVSMYIEAKELLASYATSSYEVRHSDYGVCLDIPLTGGTPGAEVSIGKGKASVQNSYLFRINVAEGLEMKISGTTVLDGARIDAATLKLDVGDLFIRSAQDIAKSNGFKGNLGLNVVSDASGIFKNAGLQFKRGDSKWVNEISHIIGRENVEILVARVLKITGAMIANAEVGADGELTDKGKLKVKAAELIAESLRGYDNGRLLGASAELAKKDVDLAKSYGVQFGSKSNEQTVHSTIGNGKLKFDKQSGSLNRDVSNLQALDKDEIKEIDAKLTLIDLGKYRKATAGSIIDRATQPFVDIYEWSKGVLGFGGDKGDGNEPEGWRCSTEDDTCNENEARRKIKERNKEISDRVFDTFVEALMQRGVSQLVAEIKVSEAIVEAIAEGSARKGEEVAYVGAAVGAVGAAIAALELLGQALLAAVVAKKLAEDSLIILEYQDKQRILNAAVAELEKQEIAEDEERGVYRTGVDRKPIIYWTPAHPDEGLDLRTPVHEPEIDKEGFAADGESQQTPGFEMPEYDFKIPGFEIYAGDDMKVLYKELPDTVQKVGPNYPRNAEYAGKKYPLEKLPKELQAQYPESVQLNEQGFMNFKPYAIKEVKVEGLTGKRWIDEKLANKAAGYSITPKGYTWHHVEDGRTMQCVPTDLHNSVGHTGGASAIKHGHNVK